MGELLTWIGEAFAGNAAVALPAAFVWGTLSVALSPCHLSSVPLVVAYTREDPRCERGGEPQGAPSSFRASGAGAAAYGVLLVALFGAGHAAAIALAGTSVQSVSRWLSWSSGARAVAVVRGVAGIAVMLGGAYFVWTAM